MSVMTVEDRLRSAEKRLEMIEAVLIEFLRDNAHHHVGGTEWATVDIRRLQDARHD